ncbi:MAG: hypothetical protein ABI627_16940 [Polyangiaceae bacterium]
MAKTSYSAFLIWHTGRVSVLGMGAAQNPDLIIIGSGQAEVPLATRMAAVGRDAEG